MLPEEDLTFASNMYIQQAERPNLCPECVWPDQRYLNSSVTVSKFRRFFVLYHLRTKTVGKSLYILKTPIVI